jgi:uncharacterized lipoprotein YehR (DUF1307 family)
MKRIALISVLLALVLSLSGCKKEEEPVEGKRKILLRCP